MKCLECGHKTVLILTVEEGYVCYCAGCLSGIDDEYTRPTPEEALKTWLYNNNPQNVINESVTNIRKALGITKCRYLGPYPETIKMLAEERGLSKGYLTSLNPRYTYMIDPLREDDLSAEDVRFLYKTFKVPLELLYYTPERMEKFLCSGR